MITARAWLLLATLGLIWGGTFFLTEILLFEMKPFQIVFHRVSIAAIVMLGFITYLGKKLPRDIKSWFALAIMGLLNNAIPFSAIVFGQQYISGGLASILNATTAFFGIMLSGIFLKDEAITLPRLMGTLIGIGGIAVVMGLENLTQLSLTNIGQYLIILASISYGFAVVWGKLNIKNMPFEVIVTGMLMTSSVWMFLLSVIFEGPPFAILSIQSSVAILTFSILCTAIAYLLYFRILSESGAGNLSLVTIIIPPISLLLDAVFLSKLITTQQAIGFVIIALGLLVLSGKIKIFYRE